MRLFLCFLVAQLLLFPVFSQTITPAGPVSFCGSGNLTVSGVTGPATYQWQRDGSDIPGATSVTVNANISGSYTMIISGSTPPMLGPVVVTVNSNPVAGFSFSPNNQCSNTPVVFTNTSTGTGLTYAWNFGDINSGGSNTSNATNPSHIFIGTPGNGSQSFTVTLIVTNSAGCSVTTSLTVSTLRLPQAVLIDPINNFRFCGNTGNATLTVYDASTPATNSSYQINWGDATPIYNSSLPPSGISHVYPSGTYTITYTVTNSNGCVDVKNYSVYNITNPQIGAGIPANTQGCGPITVCFPINNFSTNHPTTTYRVDFGDGSPVVNFTHPPPDSVCHTYTTTSCGSPNNAFVFKIQAKNGCDSSDGQFSPVRVYTKPVAQFTVNPNPGCTNTIINFINSTIQGSNNTCSSSTIYKWDFGDGSPIVTVFTNAPQTHIYSSAGSFTIILTAENSCGTSTFSNVVCIAAPPVPSFSLDNITGCTPLAVAVTNTSTITNNCSVLSYLWTISYAPAFCGTAANWSFTNGTNAASANPSFLFTGSGSYTITLSITNPCGTVTTARTVTVRRPPAVSINPVAATCTPGSIHPIAIVTNCGTVSPTYFWSFPGGTPSTSTSLDPGIIVYNTANNYNISLAVTNECGTTTVIRAITVNPTPLVVATSNIVVCAGSIVGPLTFSSVPAGATISWTNNNTAIGLLQSSGTSNPIPAFTATNSTALPITATINVSASNGICSGSSSFTITVNPRPALPAASTPVNYCKDAVATALTATPAAGHSLLWYTTSSGGAGSTTAPIPSTNVVGSATYYVSQVNNTSLCEGLRAAIVVTVKAVPVIAASFTDPGSCTVNNGTISISGLAASTGYGFSYIKNGGSPVTGIFTSTPAGGYTITGLSSGTYSNIFVTLVGCVSNITGPFTLVNPSAPGAPVAASNSPICSGNNLLLTANNIAGAIYSWTGPNSFTSSLANPTISNATIAAAGTYSVTVTVAGCTSVPSTVPVVINQTPVLPTVSYNNPVCTGNTLNLFSNTATTGAVIYSWTGPNGFTSTVQNPTITNAALINSGTYILTASLGTCSAAPVSLPVTIRPTPAIIDSGYTDPLTCSGNTGTIFLAGLTAGTTYNVTYTLNSGTPVSISMPANALGVVTINNLAAGNYSNIFVTLNTCISNIAGPFLLVNPTAPAAPTAQGNSPICSGGTLSLSASTTSSGIATYDWSGPLGYTSTNQNPVISGITTAASGTYAVTVTIAGCTSMPTSVPITVNQTPVLPIVSSNSPVCTGNTINLFSNSTTAGAVNYAWTGPNSFTSSLQNPTIANAAAINSGTYFVTATLGSCSSAAVPLTVLVHPTPAIIDSGFVNPVSCGGNSGSIFLGGLTIANTYSVTYTPGAGAPVTVLLTANAQGEVTITGLVSGTYNNIFVTLNNCASVSVGPFTLVDPTQPAAPSVTNNGPVCSGGTLNFTATNTSPGAPSYLWSGPNGFSSTLSNPSITNVTMAAVGIYSVTVSINGCTSPAATIPVLIDSTPVPPVISSNGPLCTDSTLNLFANTLSSGTITWLWSGPNGFSSTVQNPSISNVTTAASGSYSVIATAVQGNCSSSPASNLVVVNPTPIITTSGFTDPILCNSSTGTITLNGLSANTAYTINYLLNNTPQTVLISANATGSIIIPGLTSGTYSNVFVVLTGCKSVPVGPFVLSDPNPPPAPTAGSNTPICSGQTLSLTSTTSAVGIPSYSWTGPNGFSSVSQNPVITNTTIASAGNYFVTVSINSCISTATMVPVVINVLPAAPVVATPVSYCINTLAVPLTATSSPGYSLQWYTVPVGGVAGSTAPTPSTSLTGITPYYVSQVNSFGCEGSRDTIKVIINPDAIAQFTPTDTIKCPPYNITSNEVGLQTYPLNNSIYEWYVNGSLIGSGTVFPGYTIVAENDSVTLMLKTISLFGCKADSMSRKFYTYNLPHPSFDLIDTVGCGPLSVQVINTTPNIGLFTYHWNFGNGQTSSLSQPGNIVFLPNPTYNDTVYQVSLQIFSVCDTITVTRVVRVKSKPKALFTPNRTVGCSPMTVTFLNTSLGSNSTYYWDFGDGTSFVNNTLAAIQHTFNTGVLDTFYVKLVAVNECGSDSIQYAIFVSPNNIQLNFAVNGPQHFGCAPHTVAFVNNTSGASSFNWNFGDGNILTTTANIDTVYHTYLTPGNYTVTLTASNNCTDTTTTDFINVFPKPVPAFTADIYTACQGNPVSFTNQSVGGTSYLWQFGDGATSTLVSPVHTYSSPGMYTVSLTVFSANAPGNICTGIIQQQVQVVSTLPGIFTMSAVSAPCAPLTVTFVNQNRPSVSSNWDFGDGTFGTGDSVVHTYSIAGIYNVTLTVTVPGSCTYVTTRTVTISGPAGNLLYTGGYICYPNAVRFEVTGSNFNTLLWDFGDGTTLSSTQLVVFHNYANPGIYLPRVSLQNTSGCNILIQGLDTIKVDRITAGFTAAKQNYCGYTSLVFNDTSNVFFGTALVQWDFGDGTTGTGANTNHNYFISGTYQVQMIITSNSGCAETVSKSVDIQVNSLPLATIDAPVVKCTGNDVLFSSVIQSADSITFTQWRISNGIVSSGPTMNYTFALPGTYSVRLIAGTVNGCFDTTFHTIQINQSPNVIAGSDITICLGNSTQLTASGATQYQWSPFQGLSCNTCPNPVATPTVTTPYFVTGTNSVGCSVTATTIVTVIQPFNMSVSANDTICIGQSADLLATGATRYSWSPSLGLSNANISNPIANPIITTSYRVVGYDGFNCFTDTAFVLVAVGKYPTVNLGPDLTLSTGTILPLTTVVQNGPVRTWLWTPSTDLSCSSCPLPNATIKKNISYIVTVKNIYGCPASDTIQIKVFCEDSQVFIPNAFTPDGDGINDILMLRGKGIVSVKFFRIFNRWGELVFEKSNFPPNNAAYGWNGKIKGVSGPPDVFVYTAEVVCENGTTFIYKGNTSIIK